MITLAQILSINPESNLCLVEIPIFGKTGGKPTRLNATMMLPPGIRAGYEAGDIVFLSFTDNSLGRPIVLGQLYQGPYRTTSIDNMTDTSTNKAPCATEFNCETLHAKTKAILPKDTSFGNQVSLQDLLDRIESLETRLEYLQQGF
jgi:hypothetical protein